jgi:pyrroloquinoline quinone biosynthesis protein E
MTGRGPGIDPGHEVASAPAPPLALLAELTHRCPLRCGYCSNPLELVPRAVELDTATWRRVLEEAAELGILQVHFSGGEPTARPDLGELVGAASRAGLYTNLITSGVLLDAARIDALAGAGLDHVQLSVQDSEAQTANEIAGYAGHAKKLEVARQLREAGLPLTLNAVVHRRNLVRLGAIIELALQLGARRLEVAHVQYYGWARRNLGALLPSEAELDRASALVEAQRERLRGQLRIDYVIPDYHAQYPKACMDGWGQRFLGVTPSGAALPCHAAQTIAGLVFPSVRDHGLREIWLESAAFRHFRGTHWMPEPCRSCERREIDWGGCRCQALAFTGDAAATDPVCEKSPHHAQVLAIARGAAGAGQDATYRYRAAQPPPYNRSSTVESETQ